MCFAPFLTVLRTVPPLSLPSHCFGMAREMLLPLLFTYPMGTVYSFCKPSACPLILNNLSFLKLIFENFLVQVDSDIIKNHLILFLDHENAEVLGRESIASCCN